MICKRKCSFSVVLSSRYSTTVGFFLSRFPCIFYLSLSWAFLISVGHYYNLKLSSSKDFQTWILILNRPVNCLCRVCLQQVYNELQLPQMSPWISLCAAFVHESDCHIRSLLSRSLWRSTFDILSPVFMAPGAQWVVVPSPLTCGNINHSLLQTREEYICNMAS